MAATSSTGRSSEIENCSWLSPGCEYPPGSVDDPALPQNDAFTINEDTTLTSASWQANDSFPDGYGSAQVGGGSGPTHGSLTFSSSGT